MSVFLFVANLTVCVCVCVCVCVWLHALPRYILGTGELSTPQRAVGGQRIRIYGVNFGRIDLAESVRAWYVTSADSLCVPVSLCP